MDPRQLDGLIVSPSKIVLDFGFMNRVHNMISLKLASVMYFNQGSAPDLTRAVKGWAMGPGSHGTAVPGP